MRNLIPGWLKLKKIKQDLEELKEVRSKVEDLEDIPERVDELEENQETLLDIKSQLQTKALDGENDLQHTLTVLEKEGCMARKELANRIKTDLDVSRATAYRKIKELEQDYTLIRENEDGQVCKMSFEEHSHVSQEIEKD